MKKKSFEEFVKFVKSECRKHGVKCSLRKVNYLKDGAQECSGYFDTEQLVVAMLHPLAKQILAHEYCHLTQWRDGIKLWDQSDDSIKMLDLWIDGIDVPDIKKHISVVRRLELDNEKRTSELVDEWVLGTTRRMYIKRANAYVQFYNWMAITRRWSKHLGAPYLNKRLVAAMSDKFDMNYSRITPEIRRIFEEEGL